MRVSTRTSPDLRCAWCHGTLVGGWSCPRCGTRTHTRCTGELARCPTLGCGPVLDDRRRAAERSARQLRWSRVKTVGLLVGLFVFWMMTSWSVNVLRHHSRPNMWLAKRTVLREIHEWESYLAVGMLMLGSGLIWRLRRDIYD